MTQINLHSRIKKEALKYLGWILLFVVLWFKGCSGNTTSVQTVKVIVPEVKGKFKAKKPVHQPILIKANSPQLKKGKTVFVENPIDEKLIAENEKLKADFVKETNSLKKVIAYNKAIQLNKFSSKFEDDNLVININGIVQGEVKEITPSYTIKEKKIEVPIRQKKTVFRLLGGLEVGNTVQLDAFKLRANLMFQNRKGNIISGSFDTDKTVWVGYNISIFDLKR